MYKRYVPKPIRFIVCAAFTLALAVFIGLTLLGYFLKGFVSEIWRRA